MSSPDIVYTRCMHSVSYIEREMSHIYRERCLISIERERQTLGVPSTHTRDTMSSPNKSIEHIENTLDKLRKYISTKTRKKKNNPYQSREIQEQCLAAKIFSTQRRHVCADAVSDGGVQRAAAPVCMYM